MLRAAGGHRTRRNFGVECDVSVMGQLRLPRPAKPSKTAESLTLRAPAPIALAFLPEDTFYAAGRDRAPLALALRIVAMSRRCELTGKGPLSGHKVSHSNRKSKRRFLPNLCDVSVISDTLGRSVKLRISANALKSIDHRGGLDAFLAKANNDDLSPRALEIKRQIKKKLAAAS